MVHSMESTVDAPQLSGERNPGGLSNIPGVLVLADNGVGVSKALAVPREGLLLGRGSPDNCFAEDDWISRAHLKIRRIAGCWVFEDQGSRNGSRLNGQRLLGTLTLQGSVVVRMGRSLCWTVDDLSPHLRHRVQAPPGDGPILGGAMRRVWEEIEVASKASDTLLIGGPSGSGKELAARAFHEAHHGRDARAPFVPVNCATIPHGLAERLLFGAKRGAYSGATADSDGFVQAAHGGTLFLDELAELELLVQAKLLRVLETREVMPLGAARAQPVNLRVCAATLRDVRAEVAQGRFREDLFYRLGRPEVRLPGLASRLDEMPFLMQRVLQQVDPRLRSSAGLLEASALRPWPGNVREFIGEIRRAGFAALEAGATVVESRFLAPDAGLSLGPSSSGPPDPTGAARKATPWPSDDEIRAALDAAGGNVSGAARALGMHRNQIRRWLGKQQMG